MNTDSSVDSSFSTDETLPEQRSEFTIVSHLAPVDVAHASTSPTMAGGVAMYAFTASSDSHWP